ncbi:MAG: hypothetical protein JW958_11975 [Candidatus Eisenbacteria bacterium]|nr:hypothetical protein [Candidatus Eisenbacteria bacterium]
MAKQIPKQKKRVRPGRSGSKSENSLPFTRRNYTLFGVGIAVILLGFLMLSRNSITLAPILLVAGYCVLIPLAIALK